MFAQTCKFSMEDGLIGVLVYVYHGCDSRICPGNRGRNANDTNQAVKMTV